MSAPAIVKPGDFCSDERYADWYHCPACDHGDLMEDDNFCRNCGRPLDWSEVRRKANEQRAKEQKERERLEAEKWDCARCGKVISGTHVHKIYDHVLQAARYYHVEYGSDFRERIECGPMKKREGDSRDE